MIIKEKTRKIFAVGVDLGDTAGGTAISVTELVDSPSSPTDPPSDEPVMHLRYLKRFLPGTPYMEIARALSGLLESEELSGTRDVDVTVLLVIYQTAAGRWVVDKILNEVKRPAWRVVIGGSHSQGYSDDHYTVPKPELISILQAQLGWGLLKFAKEIPEMKALVEELIKYQDRKTNTILQADIWREHQSDDLVCAVALACWRLKKDIRFSCDWM